jgi:phosphate transport system substrate-binding protein
MKIPKNFHFAIILLMLHGCGANTSTNRTTDTPTSGRISMAIDEGYRPIFETQIDVFDSIYSQAKIDAKYEPENVVVKMLLDDSVEVVILSRKLNESEENYFKSRGFTPKWTRLAWDALAVIVHPSNRDTALTVEQVADILSGKTTNWNQINPKSALGGIQIAFDNPNSGLLRYAKDSILRGTPLAPQVFAVKTNPEVIKYVSEHVGAVGIISMNWISDTDDKGVQKFRKSIKIAEISPKKGEIGYQPYQAYLARGNYPFRRSVFIINAQGRAFGLGTGFASFVASQRGQLMMLKSGLLPANSPLRLIEVKKE